MNNINIVSPQVLWVVPLEWLRWLLVMIAMILSGKEKKRHSVLNETMFFPLRQLCNSHCDNFTGAVLLLTFWPAVEDDDKKV